MRKYDTGNTTKKKRMSKEEIREELINSLSKGEKFETTDHNEKTDKVKKWKDTSAMI